MSLEDRPDDRSPREASLFRPTPAFVVPPRRIPPSDPVTDFLTQQWKESAPIKKD